MKKILLTSTAIVAFAGAAAADVSVSGGAELGLVRKADGAAAGDDLQFHTGIDVTFRLSGETDNGLSFGGKIDLDDANEMAQRGQDTADVSAGETEEADFTVFISGGFGTLTIGDTDGAMDWALTEGGNIGNPGSIADDETSYSGYAGSYLDGSGDDTVLRYDYSFGDYAFGVSAEQTATGDEVGYALGFKGSFASLSFGVGYQEAADGSDRNLAGVSAVYSINGFSIGAMYATGDDGADGDLERLQVGAGYSVNAISLHLNYAELTDGATEEEGFGFAAAYELGDGISAHFGYGSGEEGNADSEDTYSLGLAMSF